MNFNKQELTERLLALRENARVVMAVVAALILLDGAVVLRWQFVSLGSMFSEARKLKTGIRDARNESKLSSTNKNRIADLEKEFADLNKQISDEEELPRVLESISKAADVSSVRVQTIRPMGETSVSPKAAAAKTPDKSEGVYVRQKISLTLTSGFHQLGRFIALLENSPVFLDIRQVEIRGGQEYGKQVVTIVLEVVLRKT